MSDDSKYLITKTAWKSTVLNKSGYYITTIELSKIVNIDAFNNGKNCSPVNIYTSPYGIKLRMVDLNGVSIDKSYGEYTWYENNAWIDDHIRLKNDVNVTSKLKNIKEALEQIVLSSKN